MALRLYVDNGRVNCPRRGDIDIDLCAGCAELVDIQWEGDEQVLICSGQRSAPLQDKRLWLHF